MNLRKRHDDNRFPSGNVGDIGLALFKGFAIYYGVVALLGLCLAGGVIYVVFHFVSKFW